jgi:mono/diheme cytochrome c family protein
MSARLLSLVVVLLPLVPAFGQKPSVADLTIRSRAILAQHCAGCHGAEVKRSSLNVLEHAQVVKARPVPFVRPKEPTASQLLELVEEGSMPPGRHDKLSKTDLDVLREWIASGAPSYPARFDDLFAHTAILADVEKSPAEEVPSYRYLTLHHLAADKLPITDLLKARTDFLAAMKTLTKAGSPAPQAIDATEMVFRIDLREAGWNHKPFNKLNDAGKEAGPAEGSLFDIVLMEYPHGVLPIGFNEAEKLGEKFLRPARQVRPFAFVRGDWFVDAVTTAPLGNELRELMKLFEPVPPGLAVAKPRKEMKPTASPVSAVDAWHGSDPAGESTVKGLKVETIDFSLNMPKSKFKPEDRFRLRISADEKMYFQLVWIDSAGKIDTRTKVEEYVPGKPREIVLPSEGGLSDEEGRERLMLFASSREFPAAEAWVSQQQTKKIERIFHPFFAMKKQGNGSIPDAGDVAITRRTVTINIEKPVKK